MRSLRSVFFVCCFILILPGIGASQALARNSEISDSAWSFNTKSVMADYENGDFDRVAKALMPILRSEYRPPLSDRIFAYRLLGVVYVSHPATQELGRHCWFRLFDLDPNTNLFDLYVGQEIDRVWERTRSEHALRQKALQHEENVALWLSPEDLDALEKLSMTKVKGANRLASDPLATAESNRPSDSSERELLERQNSAVIRGPKVTIQTVQGSWEENPFGVETQKAAAQGPAKLFWLRPSLWVATLATTGILGFSAYFVLNAERPITEKVYHVDNQASR